MPAQSKKRTRKSKLSQWQITALIAVAILILAAMIWILVRGEHSAAEPFDERLLELAAERVRAYAGHQRLESWSYTEADGTVLGDSEEDPANMENHANRPEVLQALNGETSGTISRPTTPSARSATSSCEPGISIFRIAPPATALSGTSRSRARPVVHR